MPNGGSDCCGTCVFNHIHTRDTDTTEGETTEAWCRIRALAVPDPFYTYCANHPKHNQLLIDVPLGPVFVATGPWNARREVWELSPDNEEVRLGLLKALDQITVEQITRYPSVTHIEEIIIKQLMIFQEFRAIPLLLRISQWDVADYRRGGSVFAQDKAIIVGLAVEALLALSVGMYLDDVSHLIQVGLNEPPDDTRDDTLAVVRYHLVRGLKYCPQAKAADLLKSALNDPDAEVRAFAADILRTR